MSLAITNKDQGVWSHEVPKYSFLAKHKCEITGGVALLAIGVLAAGGLFYHFTDQRILSIGLCAGGGFLSLVSLVRAVALYVGREKAAYRVITHNIGTWNDVRNLRDIHKLMKYKEMSLGEAVQAMHKEAPIQLTPEDKEKRKQLLIKEFEEIADPDIGADIICLQEMYEFKDLEIMDFLPKGHSYTSFSLQNENGEKDCMILWKQEKFDFLASANINYDATNLSSFSGAPDTLVVLEDKNNGMTICVNSAHLRGFSLAYGTLDESERNKQLDRAKGGDYQLKYDLNTMNQIDADLWIVAGDFNATAEHYKARLDILEKEGYSRCGFQDPTIYDANLKLEDGITPKAVKMDFIYAKGGKNSAARSTEFETRITTSLTNFERPSDHLMVESLVEVVRW